MDFRTEKQENNSSKIILISNSPEETFCVGNRIAKALLCKDRLKTCFKTGSLIALEGTLGSGKTCLVKGIANGLGVNETLTSPTYTIINEYLLPENVFDGAKCLYHIDAYRLEGDKDFEDIGGIDIINTDGITIIEWSERLQKSLPREKVTVAIEITGNFSRKICITGLNNYELTCH